MKTLVRWCIVPGLYILVEVKSAPTKTPN